MKNQRTTFSLLLTALALVDMFCILTFLGLVSGIFFFNTAVFNFSWLFHRKSLGPDGDKPCSADHLCLPLVPNKECDVNPGVISHHCHIAWEIFGCLSVWKIRGELCLLIKQVLIVEGPCSTETYKSGLRSSCREFWSIFYPPSGSVCCSTSRNSWSLRFSAPGLTKPLTWHLITLTRLQQHWEWVKTTSTSTFTVSGLVSYSFWQYFHKPLLRRITFGHLLPFITLALLNLKIVLTLRSLRRSGKSDNQSHISAILVAIGRFVGKRITTPKNI